MDKMDILVSTRDIILSRLVTFNAANDKYYVAYHVGIIDHFRLFVII